MSSVALATTSLGAASGRATLTLVFLPRYAALRAAWATLPQITTNDKLSALNGLMVPGPPQNVGRVEIRKILDGALASLGNYIQNPAGASSPQALIAANYLYAVVVYEASYDPTLRTGDPNNFAIIQQMMPYLVADPNTGVTATIVAQMAALIQPLVPWWRMNGFSAPVNILDLVNAGNLF